MKRLAARHSGRPSQEATEHLNHRIHITAGRLFIDQGYAATSMEQIATVAGVSKQTLYRRYCSKEELFVAVMVERGRSLREAGAAATREGSDPLAALRSTCSELLEFIARPEPLATYRILVAEALRFPTLADNVRAAAMEPFFDIIRTLLRQAQEAGQIRRDIGVEDALQSLFGLTMGWFLHHSLLSGQSILRTVEARRAFFDRAWDVFVQGIQSPRHDFGDHGGSNHSK